MTYHAPMIVHGGSPRPPGLRSWVFGWLTRLTLLASNLTPLAVILAILAARTGSWWFFVFTAAALLGLGSTLWVLAIAKRQSHTEKTVGTVQDAGSEVAAYLATYLLPFFALPGSDWFVKAAYLVFGFVMVLIFLNSNLLAVSPLLYVFGLKLYRIEFEDEPSESYFTIVRHKPKRGEVVSVSKWGAVLVRNERTPSAGGNSA